MKNKFFIIILMILTAHAIKAQPPQYDSLLAKSLGADDYGMKTYMLVILKTGSHEISDKNRLDSLFAGHMENMDRLVEEGKLVVAGPLFRNEKTYRGIFILNTGSEETAKEWLQTDPVIREQVLDAEIFKWYGSAALPVYLETHKRIEKVQL